MSKYVSLLRGINVGGRTVKMSDLVGCYSSLGLKDVKAYLQSGNVAFIADETAVDSLKNKIELAVTKEFKFAAKMFILEEHKLRTIVDNYPFKNDNTYQSYIIFTDKNIAASLYKQGAKLKSQIEDVALGNDVVYWKVQKGMTVKSPFSKLLVKSEFKDFHTNRNINTLLKLLP